MTDEIGRVIGTSDHVEPEGSLMVQVAVGDRTIAVRIDPSQVAILLNRLQPLAVVHAQREGQNVSLPQFEANAIGLAHQGPEVALMVSTDQTGHLVIRLNDELFQKLDSEVNRAKTYRPASPKPQ
jgi:hypothetical protein